MTTPSRFSRFWATQSQIGKLRIIAICAAVPVLAYGGVAISMNAAPATLAHGPIQAGHSDITCVGCHIKSAGSTRQQIQANVDFMLGFRETRADFGFAPVTSETCLDCHERPNERHPIYRFNEPRFIDVLANLEANSCLGCHGEHHNARAHVEPVFCSNCHDDLTLKNDPVDVPHVTLIAQEQWGTCLGCHDFHGNHARNAQTALADAYDLNAIRAYLSAGASPYALPKIHEGKTQ